MNYRFSPKMVQATRLVSTGRMAEATDLIQRLLQGEGGSASGRPSADTIDPEPPRRPASMRPLRGLGETVRALKRGTRLRGPDIGVDGTRSRAPAPLPEGASFEATSYRNAAGTCAYKLYVPSNRTAERLPLIVMLHGCTQSPDDFANGTRMNMLAEEHGCLVAYPTQAPSSNPQKCWNWFSPDHQRRGQGEPSLIAGITRQIMRGHPVDPSQVFIAGLSAGGAAAAIMAAAYPDLYAAVGVHSGLPSGAASDLPSAFTAMGQGGEGTVPRACVVPTIIFHGDQDATVHPRNGDAVAAQSTAPADGLRSTVEHGQVPGGHAYTRTLHADSSGQVLCELWTIHGAGHAWSGGSSAGSYTDPLGPDASREMLRFFFGHRRAAVGI